MSDPIDQQISPPIETAKNPADARRLIRRRKRGAVREPVGPALQKISIAPALILLVVGTLVAIILTPKEVQPKEALFWPAIVMTFSLALVPVLVSLKDPKKIFEAHHLLVLAPIYWLLLDLLQGVYDMPGISRRDAVLAFVAIALFAGGIWLGVWGRPWQMPRIVRDTAALDVPAGTLFGITVIAFFLGMLTFAIPCEFNVEVMWNGLFAGRWSAPWDFGMGGLDAFINVLQYFGYMLPALAVALAGRLGWLNMRTIIALLMAATMIAFMAQEGGRRNVGVMVGMAIICWVLMHKQLTTRGIIIVLVASGLLLSIMQIMLEYRGTGFQAMLSPAESGSIQKPEYVQVDDNYYRLCQTIQLIDNGRPYVYLKFITYVLVRPIPRVFWPGKPVDGGFDIADEVGVQGASLSMSVVGELYISGGLLAVLLGGWFYGRLAGMANQFLPEMNRIGAVILYGTMAMALFAGVRSLIDLVLISYVIIAWVILSRLYQMVKGGTHSKLTKVNRMRS